MTEIGYQWSKPKEKQ